ncbi:ribonuclease R [Solidesulfovibrio carbinoliphilus subsp. oakridgensis]|uniref:Ribonuclease R n=1 Tax=Solidesulfovibrio carbinoliphilus subsp. oakridgensis TaxID=694327 RepID=G7Q7Q3_9BACT|nr:ribonuclease R [Solidesulfovibrio carbinoliphilus]EHJ47362.1 ribonuclease R [Solidesulfovibrio carbinoliphilus subsp. oakridgensis]
MAARRRRGKSPKGQGAGLDAAAVLRIFRDSGKPLSEKEILRELGAQANVQAVHRLLDNLQEAGKLIRVQSGYGLVESMRLVTGILEISRSGVGYVLPEDKRRKDIFIHPKDIGDAWHGDKVVAAVTRERKDKNHEGRVARIIERGVKTLPCRIIKRMAKDLFLCQPTDSRHGMSFMVDYLPPTPNDPEPNNDDIMNVGIGEKLDYKVYSGKGLELLGAQGDVSVQERLVKLNHSIPGPFPPTALREAETLPDVPGEADFAGRKDLRKLDFVTIDGAKARDFDDAVYVKKRGRGYTLWVAIADVSHYVPEGGALDEEALERGNSYYFPQSVEPMLPERISNGLCSLNPDVPRLAMVAEIDFTPKGLPGRTDFYAAVIESKARLTYSQVNRALMLGDEAERAGMAKVLPMLETAEKLARAINEVRTARGNLDFDLPEPEILFNFQGETQDIRRKVRHFGHQIVEEFMIAANEAVARFLTEKNAPVLYRVHPEPDPAKLEALFKLLATTDLALKLPPTPGASDLAGVLRDASGSDLDFLVSRLAIRTMMQASYSPKLDPHFGLASTCYCHFTSPIRRYADLVVHRSLKSVFAGKAPSEKGLARLAKVAEHISRRERVAMEAEREILKRVTVHFLSDKVGRQFTGVIGSIADFGFWVELKEVMAEGMVRLSSLSDDYYTYFPERHELVGERTGRRFRLGQPVEVELTNVDMGRLSVDLGLLEGGESPAAAPAPRRKGSRRRRK